MAKWEPKLKTQMNGDFVQATPSAVPGQPHHHGPDVTPIPLIKGNVFPIILQMRVSHYLGNLQHVMGGKKKEFGITEDLL